MEEKIYFCPVCNKEFIKRDYKKCQAVYCSQKCAYKGRTLGFTKRRIQKPYNCKRKKPKKCIICGNEFIYRKKKQIYCSHRCFEINHKERMRGKNNPSYKNGNSYKKRSWRGNDWETLRLEIYKRDNYTCRLCGVKCISKKEANKLNSHKIIQCHHIKNWNKNKTNKKSVLATLCLDCHLKVHNRKEVMANGGDEALFGRLCKNFERNKR